MEVCRVVEGQRFKRHLDPQQTADMIKFTGQVKPSARLQRIKTTRTNFNNKDTHVTSFGIQINANPVNVPARVLKAPTVYYNHTSGDARVNSHDTGFWNMRERKVVIGKDLESWYCVVFAGGRAVDVSGFVREMVTSGQATGIRVGIVNPPVYAAKSGGHNIDGVENDLKSAVGKFMASNPQHKLQLIVCVLPDKGIPLYAEIKRVTDTIIGIPSQCIQADKIQRPNKQYCANVWLKINVKLGGINTYLEDQIPFVSATQTMVMGIDITHPGVGQGNLPSIAAAVASMDRHCARFAASIRQQQSHQDVIDQLKDMTIELLKQFRLSNENNLPKRILVYRDGVSDGQIASVKQSEVEAIYSACEAIDFNYRPSLTFVVLQKRHHVRFFPLTPQDETRSKNVKPGTVIDTQIVHPSYFDFFLVSHAGLQGTSRPTHYLVIHDDHKFQADEFQELTYRLCYLYCRATCAVSVCPPAYYAHLVAFRARYHFKLGAFSETSSDAAAAGPSQGPVMGMVDEVLQRVMYFM
ncbi:hypothetical protein HDU76_013146 [Blyttiomyces sp. JEL0837]|nr:hypothetical protein HDU76_013146 [Blyttiomyces sp. JEL0837]